MVGCTQRSENLGQFRILSDELVSYVSHFFNVKDTVNISITSPVWYLFGTEEFLWMNHCLRLHGGHFCYSYSWKHTTFFPTQQNDQTISKLATPFKLSNCALQSEFLYRRWFRCNVSLCEFLPIHGQAKLLQKFEKSELLHDNLFDRCYKKQPIIILNAIDDWNAMQNWTIDQLMLRLGQSSKFRISHNIDVDSEHSTKMTFENYVAYMKMQRDESPLYIFDSVMEQHANGSLLEDFDVPTMELFSEDLLSIMGNKRPDFRWFVVGPERSGASWHTDPCHTSAWNALIQGRKRWALYPPDRVPPGAMLDDDGSHDVSGRTSLQWYLDVYPTLDNESKPIEVIQMPGEVIYVPCGWWHMVLNLETTVAVTQNFVDQSNFSQFCQDFIQSTNPYDALAFRDLALRKLPRYRSRVQLEFMPFMLGMENTSELANSFRYVNDTWITMIEKVCKRHNVSFNKEMKSCLSCTSTLDTIVPMTRGLNPIFQVGTTVVVKFYSWLDILEQDLALDFLNPHIPSYENEKWAFHLLRNHHDSLFPNLLGCGYAMLGHSANSPWPWPYTIQSNISNSMSLRKASTTGGIAFESWEMVAHWLGNAVLPCFASTPIPMDDSRYSWSWYVWYLSGRRDACMEAGLRKSFNSLPYHLVMQLDRFLPPKSKLNELVPSWISSPKLIHGDLTDENILVEKVCGKTQCNNLPNWLKSIDCLQYLTILREEGVDLKSLPLPNVEILIGLGINPTDSLRINAYPFSVSKIEQHEKEDNTIHSALQFGNFKVKPRAIVDFGDAKSGDPMFDLIPVYFSVLRGNKNLFRILLESEYGNKTIGARHGRLDKNLQFRMLCLTILHPSCALEVMFQLFPDAKQAESWIEVMNIVF